MSASHMLSMTDRQQNTPELCFLKLIYQRIHSAYAERLLNTRGCEVIMRSHPILFIDRHRRHFLFIMAQRYHALDA